MQKNHTIRCILQQLIIVSLMVFSYGALAKELPKDLQPLEEVPPPPAIGSEKGEEKPEITVIQKGDDKVEEYRIGGQLYMMKITPKHGVPYYLHKEDQNGGWINDGPNPPLIIPKWTIFRF